MGNAHSRPIRPPNPASSLLPTPPDFLPQTAQQFLKEAQKPHAAYCPKHPISQAGTHSLSWVPESPDLLKTTVRWFSRETVVWGEANAYGDRSRRADARQRPAPLRS